MSQGQPATAMQVSRQTINSIEQERYTPSLPLALALARYFETTVEEMFDENHVQVALVAAPVRARARRGAVRRPGDRRQPRLRPHSLGIMAAAGAVFLFGGRSETIRGLRGDGRDERFQRIDIHATAFAGTVVIAAIIVAFVVELARGHDGAPYTWLGALGGVAYLAAVVVMRLRG